MRRLILITCAVLTGCVVVGVATEGTAGMVAVAAVVMEAVSAVLAAVTAEAEVDSDQNMMIYCKK